VQLATTLHLFVKVSPDPTLALLMAEGNPDGGDVESMVEKNFGKDSRERYISVAQAIKLVPQQCKENARQLREFMEGAEAAIKSTHPEDHELILKLIIARIEGEVKEKLLTKADRNTWSQIKEMLEENYAVKTLGRDTENWDDYRQEYDGMVEWEARLSQVEITVATLRREIRDLEARKYSHQVEGGLELIDKSVADTKNKRIEIVVRTEQGESTSKNQNPKISIRSTKLGLHQNSKEKRQECQLYTMKCFGCGEPGHLIKNCQKSICCFRCGRKGHTARNCSKADKCSVCCKREPKQTEFYM
jgi:hypothetical protein